MSLLDVLSSPKLMKLVDINSLNYQTAFEGSDMSMASIGTKTYNKHLPKNLYLL